MSEKTQNTLILLFAFVSFGLLIYDLWKRPIVIYFEHERHDEQYDVDPDVWGDVL